MQTLFCFFLWREISNLFCYLSGNRQNFKSLHIIRIVFEMIWQSTLNNWNLSFIIDIINKWKPFMLLYFEIILVCEAENLIS